MRTTVTLLLLCATPTIPYAQVAGGTMTFDQPDETLHLDSIYPAGCWQVGHPNKTVFTSAYDEPNALVTDTLLPHMDSTTCYAQFTMLADEDFVLGKRISFQYWSDMDSLQSFGWVEKQNSYSFEWNRLPLSDAYYIWYQSNGELMTDSGAVYTGRTFGWRSADIYIECMGVFWDPNEDRGGGWMDTMRLRFAFRGAPNIAGYDGWMIDSVQAEPLPCTGGVQDQDLQTITTYPNPASNSITIETGFAPGALRTLELIRSDGAVIMREERIGARRSQLNTSALMEGAYTLRLYGAGHQAVARFVVQR